jgi:hypothetical protein
MSDNVITNTVSTFISTQFPEFIREGSPMFVAFMKAYYEFLETANYGPNSSSVIYNAKNLLSYKDVDSTTSDFIQYFINDFLPYFPNDVALDERKLIKVARQFYQEKGTPQSIQFLFRVLYGKDADIYFPKQNILKTSDGKWTRPQALRLLLDSANSTFDVNQLVQRVGVGSNSDAQCVIEAAYKTVDPNLGFEIVEVYISNITKPFDDLENLMITYGAHANGQALVFQEKIIAALSGITIDPNNRGLKYNKGDPVVLTGGLEPNDQQAQKGVALVGNVTTGSVTSINVVFGGYDYRPDPNTLVEFVSAPGDTGDGATAIVSSIDTANAVFVNVNIDCLEFHSNNVLNGSGWGFTGNAGANWNCAMQNAFSYANLEFAPIRTMTVTAQGGGYKTTPNVQMEVVYYTDLTNALVLAADPSYINTVQNIDDLGMFAAVQVLRGGTNYSNVHDAIYLNTNIGNNVAFDFITDAITGAVTSVIVLNRGAGYIDIQNITCYLANTANRNAPSLGANAVLQPYGFGQGANLEIGVNKIGQIVDFNLLNRGFDYIASPNVSLRIQDVDVVPLGINQIPLADAVVYQGSNVDSAIYVASVDSISTNNVIRLYNYRGAINIYQELVVTLTDQTQINVSVNIANLAPVHTYGNGQAKANAIFLNGLINYPGFYLNTDGMLSSDQYLQDANTYHNYSYQIIVEKALSEFKNVLLQIAHPAGTSMLGKYVIPAIDEVDITYSSDIKYTNALQGNVNVSTTGIVTGNGTLWVSQGVVAGDLITFDTGRDTANQWTKIITAVSNQTTIHLESEVLVRYNGAANVANLGIIVTLTGNTPGNVVTGDACIIAFANGNNVTYNITSLDPPNQFIIDGLVEATDGGNNLPIAFIPHYNVASYIITASTAT